MGQINDQKVSPVLIADIKELHKAIEALTSIQANLKYPQTDLVEKAKAALADRFLKDNFNLEPSQVLQDGKSSS